MKYVLDTNMCIYAQKQNPIVLENIKKNYRDGLAISSITLAELEYGVKASAAVQKNASALIRFLSVFDILDFDSSAAIAYGTICADLRRKGTPIGNMDMLIAAHALSAGLIIVTHNVREFKRVSGLMIDDWYEPASLPPT